ncbi:MAG TPA: RelA/SpoT domain-containing protein [Candidatus Microsaccharimonas sp.]|jgi:ppGpp synthetase/RelA/SpoT-type nucleotidyltranferase
MKYPINPHYSNTTIKKAGNDIRLYSIDSEEYKNAVKTINNWRVAHGFPMSIVAKSLGVRTRKYKNSLVAQRLKRLPTIINKLGREPDMALSRMQDIGGARAVVNTVSDVYDLLAYYQKSRKFSPYIKTRDYIAQPKPGGYRGIHVIFKYDGSMSPSQQSDDYTGLSIEAQLRTQLQHTWATAVETLSTMRGENYKAGFGHADLLEFFALSSAAFSILEESPAPDRFEGMNIVEICKSMIKLDDTNNILGQITGYAYAADIIDSKHIGGDYNLITLDVKKHIVDITSFSSDQLEVASEAYRKTEERAARGENIESVLVSAGKLKSLKLAYPNYFLDISSFYEKIHVMYSTIDDDNL